MFFRKKKKVISVEGMTCDHCALKIQTALEKLIDVVKVKVDLKSKLVLIYYQNEIDSVLLQKTIEGLGYTVTGVREEN